MLFTVIDASICALHGWQFDVTSGDCLLNPAIRVRTFEVKVEDDGVFIKVE